MLKLARYLKYFKKEVTIGPFFKFLEAVFELIGMKCSCGSGGGADRQPSSRRSRQA